MNPWDPSGFGWPSSRRSEKAGPLQGRLEPSPPHFLSDFRETFPSFPFPMGSASTKAHPIVLHALVRKGVQWKSFSGAPGTSVAVGASGSR